MALTGDIFLSEYNPILWTTLFCKTSDVNIILVPDNIILTFVVKRQRVVAWACWLLSRCAWRRIEIFWAKSFEKNFFSEQMPDPGSKFLE